MHSSYWGLQKKEAVVEAVIDASFSFCGLMRSKLHLRRTKGTQRR
jgi:hypothetical protein